MQTFNMERLLQFLAVLHKQTVNSVFSEPVLGVGFPLGDLETQGVSILVLIHWQCRDITALPQG